MKTLALSLFALTGCSLVIDTEPLTAGKAGLNCTEEEKICPMDSSCADASCEELELFECVATTIPERGCGAPSCQPCALAGAVPRCNSQNECAIAVCSGRNENCDGKEENGCEVDLGTDSDNCGACGRECRRENAVADCVNGVCFTVLCLKPFEDCDGNLANGCETNTADSLLHCGGCKQKCDGTCENGQCVL